MERITVKKEIKSKKSSVDMKDMANDKKATVKGGNGFVNIKTIIIAAVILIVLVIGGIFVVPKLNQPNNIYTAVEKKGEILLENTYKKDLIVSKDAKAYAYVAVTPEGKEYAVVIKDDKITKSAAYNGVFDLQISPDGTHYAFRAATDDKISFMNGATGFAVIDGKELDKCEYINELYLSDDWKHFMYRVSINGEWKKAKDGSLNYTGEQSYVVRDGVPGETYDIIRELKMSNDGMSYVYRVTNNGKWEKSKDAWDYEYAGDRKYFIVKNGVAGDMIGDLRMSDDGKHYVFIAGVNGKWAKNNEGFWKYSGVDVKYFPVLDAAAGEKFNNVLSKSLFMDAAGLHYSFAAGDTADQPDYYFVADGKKSDKKFFEIKDIVIDAMGYSFSAKNAKESISENFKLGFSELFKTPLSGNTKYKAFIENRGAESFLKVEKL